MEFIVEVIDSKKQKKEIIINALDRTSAISNVRSQGYLIVGMIEKPNEPAIIDDSSNLKQITKFQEIGRRTLQAESMVLTCHVCNSIMAKELKKCPHCGAKRKLITKDEATIGNIAGGIFIFIILISMMSQCSSNKTNSFSSYSSSPSPSYKSKKSLWEMNREEKDEINEAWPTMSPEEKRKQIKRDFY